MNQLRPLANDLTQWARRDPAVRALMWYGSFARGDWSVGSDLDVLVLHDSCASHEEVVTSLLSSLGGRARFVSRAGSRREAAIWVDAVMTKVDLHLGTEHEHFAWITESPDIAPPRVIAAVDKRDECGDMVARAAKPIHRDITSLAAEEIEKFLIGFEACSAAHRRSDGYQFYFHYNLALHRLARLVELSRGRSPAAGGALGPAFLFLPKLLLSRRMSLDEQRRWRAMKGTLYLPEANASKREIAAVFLTIVQELSRQVSLRRNPAELQSFLNAIIRRDLLFNVRDFADAFGGRVRPGRLFRASALTRWRDEPALREWLDERRIRTIVDFRHPSEMNEAVDSYPSDLLQDRRYVNLPLSGEPRRDHVPPPASMGPHYAGMFQEHVAAVVAGLREIAGMDDGAAVVHCHVGKDRTGWFCATVAWLLNLPMDEIEHDYMLSGQAVEAAAIQHFCSTVLQAGVAEKALRAGGFTETDRERLCRWLLTV